MPRAAAALLVALALLAAAGGAQGQFAPRRPNRNGPQRRCRPLGANSDSAWRQLKAEPGGSKCSDLIWGLNAFKLWGLLRQVSRGKAIVCPTNSALQARFMKTGLYKRPFDIPQAAKTAFRNFVQKELVVKREAILSSYGCGVLYAVHRIGSVNNQMVIVPKKAWTSLSDEDLEEAPEYKYSVLGTGYNSYTGFPLSFGMAAIDPGLTLSPIFQLTAANVRSIAQQWGGSCQSQFSSSTYNSASNMKESISASLDIKGNFSGIAFSASASFNMVSQTSMTSQTITTNSGAKVYLGGWGLTGGPGGLSLEQSFIDNLEPLMQAASEDRWDAFALSSLINNYGTHYVRTVWFGGMAAVINQMTAQSYSSLSSLGVSVSIAVQASMIQVSADVDYEKTNSEEVSSVSSTFSQILIPSSVPLALTSSKVVEETNVPVPSFIDCVQWTGSLREAMIQYKWRPPVHYTIVPITEIFSFPRLFPSDWRSVLPAMQRQVYRYMTTCGHTAKDFFAWQAGVAASESYTACPEPSALANCVVGTYRHSSGGCNSCYGDGSVVGPNCNSTTAFACTKQLCLCMPKWANKAGGGIAGGADSPKTCDKLAPAPPAPPAPSEIDLLKRKLKFK